MDKEQQKEFILNGNLWKVLFDLSWPAIFMGMTFFSVHQQRLGCLCCGNLAASAFVYSGNADCSALFRSCRYLLCYLLYRNPLYSGNARYGKAGVSPLENRRYQMADGKKLTAVSMRNE